MKSSAMAADPKLLRQAFGKFVTGVTVITTRQPDGAPRGFTANSFTSVSLDPPLLLVCIGKGAASLSVFENSECFAVNVLAESQKPISGLFASQHRDKFEKCAWHPGETNAPVIDGSLAWFECARHNLVDAGDHVILIGRVLNFATGEGMPLGFFQGNYLDLGIENKLLPVIDQTAGLVIGALYENNGSILLSEPVEGGAVSVPAVGRRGTPASLDALRECYAGPPLNGELDFVYAVFEDRRTKSVTVYYRGRADGTAPEGGRFYAFDEIPFDRIEDSAERTMISRYVGEARAEGFAIYVGDDERGQARAVL